MKFKTGSEHPRWKGGFSKKGHIRSSHLCECGCGQYTYYANHSNQRLGIIAGQPYRFISGHNGRRGKIQPILTAQGYRLVSSHGHPRAMKNCFYVFEHLIVVEKALGHYLEKPHEVHHVNEIKHDNRNENLVICEDRKYHLLLHTRAEAYRATGDAHSRKCVFCYEWVLPNDPNVRWRKYTTGSPRVAHRFCENNYVNQRYHARKMTI